MDDDTATLIFQLQEEDLEQLHQLSKGKGHEGTLTDAELAMSIYKQELADFAQRFSDHRMTRSIAAAVQTDGRLLQDTALQEQAASHDRQVAQRLQGGDAEQQGTTNADASDRHKLHDETIEKLRALWVIGTANYDDKMSSAEHDEEAVAESSSWGASRTQPRTGQTRRCEACQEHKRFWDVARAPCAHEYCRECTAELFEAALKDDSRFPPRCCRRNIVSAEVRMLVEPELIKAYEKKLVEFETPNRTYCCMQSCSAFIPPAEIERDVGTCASCGAQTCTTCKSAAHGGDCPNDPALQMVLDAGRENQWQRCHACWAMVELHLGCNHMTDRKSVV